GRGTAAGATRSIAARYWRVESAAALGGDRARPALHVRQRAHVPGLESHGARARGRRTGRRTGAELRPPRHPAARLAPARAAGRADHGVRLPALGGQRARDAQAAAAAALRPAEAV